MGEMEQMNSAVKFLKYATDIPGRILGGRDLSAV